MRDRKGIYKYLLSGKQDTRLLDVRVFDDVTKRTAYASQTKEAMPEGTSNCPLCPHGYNANKTRIYKLSEMDADHVTAWSNGGTTSLANYEMLCVPHNRSKGNR